MSETPGPDPTAFLHGAVTCDGEQLPVPVNKGGRPTTYSAELAAKICERVAEGEGLRLICAEPDMPGRATVFRWLDTHADFRLAYTYAMQAKIEGVEDEINKTENEIIEIADDATDDLEVEPLAEEGGPVVFRLKKSAIARAKLQIGAREGWIARAEARKARSEAKKYAPPPITSAAELLPPGSAAGDNARDMGEALVIDNHPIGDALKAWDKVAAPAAQGTPE